MSLLDVFKRYENGTLEESLDSLPIKRDIFVWNNVFRSDSYLFKTVYAFQEMELLNFLTNYRLLNLFVDDSMYEWLLTEKTIFFIDWLERENINMSRFEKSLKKNFTSIINLIEKTSTYNSNTEKNMITSQITNMTFREKESLYLYAYYVFDFTIRGPDDE